MGSRRDFLKRATVGSVGAAVASCAPVSGDKLIPYLVPPDDEVPGEAVWYATACRECPAGCGVLARVREGRVVKLEGNPEHPGNRGALCPRGQAGLQGLYDPDRITGPLVRAAGGELEPASWEEALERLDGILGAGPVGWIGHHVTGTLDALIDRFLASRPGSRRVRYEALGYESVRTAWQRLLGRPVVPAIDLSGADLIVGFGADFLETWMGNVAMTRGFAAARTPRDGARSRFVHIAPRRGLTGDNADTWLAIEPGSEAVLAAALALEVLGRVGAGLDAATRQLAQGWLRDVDPDAAAVAAGITPAQLRALADRLVEAAAPVVLGGGHAVASPAATDLETAVGLLDLMLGAVGRSVLPERPSALGALSSTRELAELLDAARDGEVPVLLLHHVDPVYVLPPGAGAAEALQAARVVSFARQLDDSTSLADLVLPDHAPLESWGDHEGASGVTVLQQPVMRPLHDTRATGDVLGHLLGQQPEGFLQGAVRAHWNEIHQASGAGGSAADFWQQSQRRGGYFGAAPAATPPAARPEPTGALAAAPAPIEGPPGGLVLVGYPTIQLFDGRGANRGWLQEAPDPVTKMTWGSWVEIHPEDAAGLGIDDGDRVELGNDQASVQTVAVRSSGLRRGVIGMPLGHGHRGGGELAAGLGASVASLLPWRLDPASGALARLSTRVQVRRIGPGAALPRTQAETSDHGRGLARFLALPAARLANEGGHGDGPHEFYGDHEHAEHRWGMAIDLNACVGCGACEIACSAENNIPVVGPGAISMGREMAWIRIDRFEQPEGTAFVPMLCQQCDNAPCETVCPVNATYHTEEGLNGMVYNRCVGTRYCSNNCPYKVRRFNWSHGRFREPLHLQLNPDVTPRSMGVMEKCTFCVQRIKGAERDARRAGRELADGDITTACAQTCPAGAIVFGDLKDPDSRASQLSHDGRAYRIFEDLNTKPAISYLARTRLPEGGLQ